MKTEITNLHEHKISSESFSIISHVVHYIAFLVLAIIGLILYHDGNVGEFINSLDKAEIVLILTVTGYAALFSQIFTYIYKHR